MNFIKGILRTLFRKSTQPSVFERLESRFEKIRELMDVRESLVRDFLILTKPDSMPDKKRQIRRISMEIQATLRDPALKKDLRRADAQALRGRYGPERQRHLQEMLAMHRLETALSAEDAVHAAQIEAEGREFHKQVKAENTPEAAALALEKLQEIVTFKRKQGALIAEKIGLASGEPYDGLLQIYCPGMSGEQIAQHFDRLAPQVRALMEECRTTQGAKPAELPGSFPPERQLSFLRELIRDIGFDSSRGDLYTTGHHPIEGGTRNDAKPVIGTLENSGKAFRKALQSALHEAAHGVYLQNLPADHQYDLLGMPQGTDMWEAFALGYEMDMCRSREFCHHLAGRINRAFAGVEGFEPVEGEHLFHLANHVEPGFIRIAADDVTYHLHIAIRFELERALINGDLEVADLPQAWNRLYKEHFGAEPSSPAEGFLQDVHWLVGKFGYFPAYSLGLIEFAHLAASHRAGNPHYAEDLRSGNFSARITPWYAEHFFSQGRLADRDTLIRQATGEDLNPDYLAAQLQARHMETDHPPQSLSAPAP